MTDELRPCQGNDPDAAWLNGIIGQVNKEGGMARLRFKTIEKLIRVAQEGIALRAEVERMTFELKLVRESEASLLDCLNGSTKARYTAEQYDAMSAEVERLTTENAELRKVKCDHWGAAVLGPCDACKRRAQIEKGE